MGREIQWYWTSFQLTIKNVEALVISNIKGVFGAIYLCLKHDEGFVYGSFGKKENKHNILEQLERIT